MIVGFSINSMSAKRNDIALKRDTEINVNTTPTIKGVELVDALGKNDTAKFAYSFECKYVPDIGQIFFEGDVLWKGKDNEETENVVHSWKETETLHKDAALEVINTIFRRCLTKAIMLSEELRLPPPLQFPVVTAQQDAGAKENKEAKVKK